MNNRETEKTIGTVMSALVLAFSIIPNTMGSIFMVTVLLKGLFVDYTDLVRFKEGPTGAWIYLILSLVIVITTEIAIIYASVHLIKSFSETTKIQQMQSRIKALCTSVAPFIEGILLLALNRRGLGLAIFLIVVTILIIILLSKLIQIYLEEFKFIIK